MDIIIQKMKMNAFLIINKNNPKPVENIIVNGNKLLIIKTLTT